MGTYAHGIEAAVKRFQFRIGMDSYSDPASRPVFDIDRDAHRDFSLIAKRLQSFEASRFHQPNHIWSRIHRWQLGMMRRKSVLQFDGFIRLAAYADGDRSGHDFQSMIVQRECKRK
jgi:hypothetical protein